MRNMVFAHSARQQKSASDVHKGLHKYLLCRPYFLLAQLSFGVQNWFNVTTDCMLKLKEVELV